MFSSLSSEFSASALLPGVLSDVSDLQRFQSYWKPGIAVSARQALKEPIDYRVAAWCLEQRPGGRRYIDLIPASNNRKERVWNAHIETRTQSRLNAFDSFNAKWGDVVGPKAFHRLFSKRIKVFDEYGKPACVYPYNTHHGAPVFWGGGNDTRTYIERGFHKFVHQKYDTTIRYVKRCLRTYDREVVRRFYEPGYVRGYLLDNPVVAEAVGKIPDVKVHDGTVSVAILYSTEPTCVPQLLRFEYQYGGIYGPEEKGYNEGNFVRQDNVKKPYKTDYLLG